MRGKMNGTDLLKDKKILIVDDEQDILETLEELLSMCRVVKASSFDSAAGLLKSQKFDLAILDIMGVDGYALLEIANKKKIPAVMLTAHALSPQDTVKSFKGGAASYVPKELMENITTYLIDVLEAQKEKKVPWWRWSDRFEDYYDRRFGPDWKDVDKEFWKTTIYQKV
jgi:DNA-binding NtrC family response regulator